MEISVSINPLSAFERPLNPVVLHEKQALESQRLAFASSLAFDESFTQNVAALTTGRVRPLPSPSREGWGYRAVAGLLHVLKEAFCCFIYYPTRALFDWMLCVAHEIRRGLYWVTSQNSVLEPHKVALRFFINYLHIAPVDKGIQKAANAQKLAEVRADFIKNEGLVREVAYRLGRTSYDMELARTKSETAARLGWEFGCMLDAKDAYHPIGSGFLACTSLYRLYDLIALGIRCAFKGKLSPVASDVWTRINREDPLQIGPGIVVRDVFKGSPLEGQVQPGDEILSITYNNVVYDASTKMGRMRILWLFNHSLDEMHGKRAAPSISLCIKRGESELLLEKIKPLPVYNFPTSMQINTSSINAYAYIDVSAILRIFMNQPFGLRRVNITKSLIDRVHAECGKDVEKTKAVIAEVLGHEMTHHAHHHILKGMAFRALTLLCGLYLHLLSYVLEPFISRAWEYECDKGGLYLTKNAGFERWKEAALVFEKVFPLIQSSSFYHRVISLWGLLDSHPQTELRAAALRVEISKLEARASEERILLPESMIDELAADAAV